MHYDRRYHVLTVLPSVMVNNNNNKKKGKEEKEQTTKVRNMDLYKCLSTHEYTELKSIQYVFVSKY